MPETKTPTRNEAIHALERQLRETRIELEKQKWLLDQIMQSGSWKLTTPLRWGLAQWRRLFESTNHQSAAEAEVEVMAPYPDAEFNPPDPGAADTGGSAKDIYATLAHALLRSFLAGSVRLTLPQVASPRISIVLVLFNRAELTFACLRSIVENAETPLEVLIVDNASTDMTGELLDRVDGARIIRNRENVHFLRGANQAAAHARGDHILLLNNDAQLQHGALAAVLRTIESSDDIGAVGGRILLMDGVLQEAGSIIWRDGSCRGYGRGDDPEGGMYMFRRDVDYCSGAFLLTRRTWWERLGGLDPAFAPAYYEETDYCMRLVEAGARIVYEPDAVVLHYEFASSTTAEAAIAIQADHQRIFRERHRALLDSLPMPSDDAVLAARMRMRGQRPVLFIDDRVPHRWLGSGFPRANDILQSLVRQGAFITLYPTADPYEPWSTVYRDIPREVEVMRAFRPGMLEAFLNHRKGYYRTILVSRPHNMQMLQPVLRDHPGWFAETTIVYDAEAVFVSREVGRLSLSGAVLEESEKRRMLDEELALTAWADIVVSVSGRERDILMGHGVKDAPVLGHMFEATPTSREFKDRFGILFVGAIHEEDSPNGDSVIWFLESILPLIRESIGSCPVTIAGINRSGRVEQLAGTDVRITGWLQELAPVFDSHRIFIAPTRFAAGIPHKIHQAAAHGLPVVATPLLAEQLGWTDGVDLLTAATAVDFAAACIRLYEDEGLWRDVRSAALGRIETECSPAEFERGVGQLLKQGKRHPQ